MSAELDPTTPALDTGRKLRERLDILPRLRDAVVVALATMYAVGHVVWTLYSHEYGLGLRPAAQAQYFIAGAPALATTALFTLVFLRGPYWLVRLRDIAIGRFGSAATVRIALLAILA